MAAPDKIKALFEDLGKPTLRGVRKCPKCGTYNGTRGISCKNKACDVIFKEKESRKGHSAEAVKIITGSNVQVSDHKQVKIITGSDVQVSDYKQVKIITGCNVQVSNYNKWVQIITVSNIEVTH